VDAVISSVSPMHTYGTLLSGPDVPARMSRRARRAPLSFSGFVLQLGLANRIEARGHTHCTLPWLGQQSQIFQSGSGAMRWSTYTVPTLTLPELAPAGCSVVEMYPSADGDMAPESWNDARKKAVVAQAVEMLRREHHIEVAVCRALSPREFQDRTHLYAGAFYGISPLAGPAALFKHRTPIRGLYQAGQCTWPGFGVVGAGMSGVFAAQALMRNESL